MTGNEALEMEKMDIDEIAKWSPWPRRLLGLDPWSIRRRTLDRVAEEYNQDVYASTLQFWQTAPRPPTPEEVYLFQCRDYLNGRISVSKGDDLFLTSFAGAVALKVELMVKTLQAECVNVKTIVELGAGYGINLWRLAARLPNHTFVGADYSENAVQLGGHLYSTEPRIQMVHFNFYEPGSYEFLERYPSPLLIFTTHALEQLPSCAVVLDTLYAYRASIERVIHFEPLYLPQAENLLGLMRARYVQANDYNQDLLGQLSARHEIELLSVKPNVLGENPFNPTSIITWRYR